MKTKIDLSLCLEDFNLILSSLCVYSNVLSSRHACVDKIQLVDELLNSLRSIKSKSL